MGAGMIRCRIPRSRRREDVAVAQDQERRAWAGLHGYRASQQFRKSRYRYLWSDFGNCHTPRAHVYGLTKQEFARILSTFPLVTREVKDAAIKEFRKI